MHTAARAPRYAYMREYGNNRSTFSCKKMQKLEAYLKDLISIIQLYGYVKMEPLQGQVNVMYSECSHV